MTEFQAALLLAQMTRIEAQARTRTENASYLTSLLKEIPGIEPARMYDGCTRNAYHLYMFRYEPAAVSPAFREPLFSRRWRPREFRRPGGTARSIHSRSSKTRCTRAATSESIPPARLRPGRSCNRCPANDKLCGEAVWFTQTMLLAPRESMERIAEAIRKIRKHAGELAKASPA